MSSFSSDVRCVQVIRSLMREGSFSLVSFASWSFDLSGEIEESINKINSRLTFNLQQGAEGSSSEGANDDGTARTKRESAEELIRKIKQELKRSTKDTTAPNCAQESKGKTAVPIVEIEMDEVMRNDLKPSKPGCQPLSCLNFKYSMSEDSFDMETSTVLDDESALEGFAMYDVK